MILVVVNMIFPFYTKESFLSSHAVLVFVLFYSLIVLTANTELCEFLMDAMVVIAIAFVLMQSLQALGLDPMFYDRYGNRNTRAIGLMSNPGETAAVLAFCLPAFFRRPYQYGIIAVVGGLILVKATMGIIAAGVGVVFFLYFLFGTRWMFIGIPVCITSLVAYFIYVDMPGVERWDVWKTGFAMWQQHWILGSGIGHWKAALNFPINEHMWKTAHNEFLQALFEQGIMFPIILGGYLINIFRRAKIHILTVLVPLTALVIIATNCTANFAMHIAPTAMLAMAWLAILEVKLREIEYE
jgi:hypothetical protein